MSWCWQEEKVRCNRWRGELRLQREGYTAIFEEGTRQCSPACFLRQLTCLSRESSLHSQTHLRKLLMSTTRLQSLRNHHALHSVLSVFRNALPPNPSQLQTYHRVSRVSSPSTRRF